MELLNLNAHMVCAETKDGFTVLLPPYEKVSITASLFDESALDGLIAKNVRVFRLS